MVLEVLRMYANSIPDGTWPRLKVIGLGALIDNWQEIVVPPSCLEFRLYAVHWIRDYWGSFHAGVIEVGHGSIGDAYIYSDCLDIFQPNSLDIPKQWVHGL